MHVYVTPMLIASFSVEELREDAAACSMYVVIK
jgi:hypothetical protein